MKLSRILTTTVLLVSASFTTVTGYAADAATELKSLMGGYSRFSATFQQVTYSGQGRSRNETSTGTLAVAKPNLFRWQASEPFPQEIVSDGEFVWIHDPDLEQVTRRALDDSTSNAPAMILNGRIDQLEERYSIVALAGETPQMKLYELTPKSDQDSFQRIRLAFAEGVLSELMLEDSLGQRTTILFNDQQVNPDFSEDMFRFELPEGADLIVDPGV